MQWALETLQCIAMGIVMRTMAWNSYCNAFFEKITKIYLFLARVYAENKSIFVKSENKRQKNTEKRTKREKICSRRAFRPLQWAFPALQCIGFIALRTLQTLGMLGMNKILHSLRS
ncbi:hypothetical protein HZA99_06165 [Candidatus Woesearchaeota archaeon]|nr:hypothetical protein [Candidatus Woesearchaeota archaeon]